MCDCAIAVEMKLGAKSSDNQILKYAALLTWEEIYSGPKQEVGLLYIVPELDLPQHWDRCGLTGPKINTEILSRTMKRKLNPTILALIEQHPDLFHSTLTRMKLHVISWTMFRESLVAARHGLDLTKRGDQTLSRLLQGILAQLAVHEGTGLLQT